MTLLQRCFLLLCIAGCVLAADQRELMEALFKSDKRFANTHVRPPGTKNANLTAYGLSTEVKGDPVIVVVNMFVRYIGEINDDTKDYKVSLTLRQEWKDPRLAYSAQQYNITTLTLTDPDLIWTPDLFFSNEKEGQLHDLMKLNTLIRIKSDGQVLYSSRVSLKLTCAMDFTNFPMDKQTCSIRMASYAYTTNDIVFVWKEGSPVQASSTLDATPYDMLGFGYDYCNSLTNTGEYSCLRADFLFIRMLSTWIMHAYLPLGLLVLVSWIPFWVDERAMALRVLVAVIVLVATIAEGARVSESAPESGHSRGIDSWTNWTLFFVFLALLEQVLVILVSNRAPAKTFATDEEGGMAMTPLMESNGTETIAEADKPAETAPKAGPKPNLIKQWLSRFDSIGRRIDVVCRILFPVVFIIFFFSYWATYEDYEGLRSLSSIKKIAYN